MSIEVWQFPRSGTKAQLTSHLQGLGYVIGKNVFWPGPPGTVALFWSEPKDFKSTSGVDASIFPLDDEGKQVWKTTGNWALRTRTSIWATSYDLDFQNRTVRSIRKAFGGSFYNDHFGRGRYNVIRRQKSTPGTRGVHAVLTRVTSELDQLESALPEDMISTLITPSGTITPANDPRGILAMTKRSDPARIVFNALTPFLVASTEHFFRECFEILLKDDPAALAKAEKQNKKVLLDDVVKVHRGVLPIERIVSDWYSFQNLDQINKAYSDVLGIDILKPLRVRKKIRGKLPLMYRFLQNLITARHGVVHHFSLNLNLDRSSFLDLLHSTRALLQLAAKEIESKLGVALGPG